MVFILNIGMNYGFIEFCSLLILREAKIHHFQVSTLCSFYIHFTSAKTKSPSSNLFSLLYPQTQKNEIEVSLKYGIALLFQSVL
jgi:hypothetical protein